VRRGWILLVTMAALVAGGVYLSFARDVPLPSWVPLSAGKIGAILMLGAAFTGVAAVVLLMRDTNQLTRTLRLAAEHGKHGMVTPPSRELRGLANALGDLMESTEKSVNDALMQAKELEIQLKVATAERHHAEAIIYSISDAVLVTDPFDDVVLANDSAARMLGFDLAHVTRKPIGDILKDPKLTELIREMRQSDSRSGRRIIEHPIRTSEGDRTFKVTLSCVAGSVNAAVAQSVGAGVVTVLHDMTREKEVAEMKNDFVSNVSHELRTPLASIKAYVEMLIDGEADDEKTQREFYEVIQNESNRLSRLIDNILNISRIESGLVKINKQPQSLMVIVKEAIEVITPQAKAKNIKIIEHVAPSYYQTLADKDMLYQAVLNLMSNSVKYTPENGSITVQTLVDENKKKVLTRISDTGVGIPPKDLPYVFDKFYRVEANNHMAKGTGLGLPLVKHIVEQVHKGRIFVESTVGKGTIFGFELDLV